MNEPSLQGLATRRGVFWVWGPLLVVGCLHVFTPPEMHWVHDLARRLFYLPIVAAGGIAGAPGGVLTATVTIGVYLPHALGHAGHDPGGTSEKALEMAFYMVLGAASGFVAQRIALEGRQQAALGEDLQKTLNQVQAKDAQLERAARLSALGELTAGLAHEIRNPLHGMRGSAEILLDTVDSSAPEHRIGQNLIGEVDRLDGLLTRFLDFAKHSAPRVEPTDLQGVAVHVAELIEAQAARQQTKVAVVEAADATMASCDRDQLIQVVLGIGINALQALKQGGTVTLCVVVRDVAGTPHHGIEVGNDGPHIDETLMERVFDPFFSTREMGTGLGLSTAWRIIDAHGGRIEVRNLPEGGVAFGVLLPA